MAKKVYAPENVQDRKELGLKAGDTVKVHQKIKEKDKFRTQIFEGIIIAVKHKSEAGATFTVRKVSSGVGVERIFPLYSPMIDKVEVVRRSRMRKAKLYFVRDMVAKGVRRKMRNFVDYIAPVKKEEVVTEEAEAPAETEVAA